LLEEPHSAKCESFTFHNSTGSKKVLQMFLGVPYMSISEFLKMAFLVVPAFWFAIGLIVLSFIEEKERFTNWRKGGAHK
jgi:hypothetical protein